MSRTSQFALPTFDYMILGELVPRSRDSLYEDNGTCIYHTLGSLARLPVYPCMQFVSPVPVYKVDFVEER
jgi:hypothetical protein